MNGIINRATNGSHEKTAYAYLSHTALVELLRRKSAQVDGLRLAKLNDNRKLATRGRQLDDYKKFVMAVGDHRVARVDALVRVGRRNGASIRTIIKRMDQAAQGLYKPKGYTEEEMLRGLLFLRLGGARVADLAHRTMGTPSTSTMRRNSVLRPLQPSLSMPTVEEIEWNIQNIFGAFRELGQELKGAKNLRAALAGEAEASMDLPMVVMVDEVHCEPRPRYDASSGKIVGLCREHTGGISLQFESLDEAELACEAVDEGRAHLAVEVSIPVDVP